MRDRDEKVVETENLFPVVMNPLKTPLLLSQILRYLIGRE